MAERCLCGYGILPVSKCYGVVNDAHCSPAVKNITKKNKRGVKEMDDIIKRGKENKCRGRERLTQRSEGGERERDGWTEKREAGRSRERDTQEERGCSAAADQMIHDKLAQRTDLWGHRGR